MNDLCYLCGKSDPNIDEHVVADCLLPKPATGNINPIILRAHKACSDAYSMDEEYLRGLVEGAAGDFDGGHVLHEKHVRSMFRPASQAYRDSLFRHARIVNLETHGGIFLGPGLALRSDNRRLRRIGRKIGRGILFRDQGVYAPDESVDCAYLPPQDIEPAYERNMTAKKPLWTMVFSENASLCVLGPGVGVRRIYFRQRMDSHPGWKKAWCAMVVQVYAIWFLIKIPIPSLDQPIEKAAS